MLNGSGMGANQGLILEVAMRMELIALANAISPTVYRKKTQVANMDQKQKVWREASESEKTLLRQHLEELWETSEHPKRNELWEIAFELGSVGGHTEVEEMYARLISLVK